MMHNVLDWLVPSFLFFCLSFLSFECKWSIISRNYHLLLRACGCRCSMFREKLFLLHNRTDLCLEIAPRRHPIDPCAAAIRKYECVCVVSLCVNVHEYACLVWIIYVHIYAATDNAQKLVCVECIICMYTCIYIHVYIYTSSTYICIHVYMNI